MSAIALSLRTKTLASVALVAIGAAGTATNRLTVPASGLGPGDTVARQAQLTNAAGNQGLSSITLSAVATPSSLLDSDTTNGLQLTVQSCATPWTETGTAPNYTYTCSVTATTVLTSRPVSFASPVNLTGLNTLAGGGTDNLLFTETFPTAAGNTLQTLSSTMNFTLTGTQRAGTAKLARLAGRPCTAGQVPPTSRRPAMTTLPLPLPATAPAPEPSGRTCWATGPSPCSPAA